MKSEVKNGMDGRSSGKTNRYMRKNRDKEKIMTEEQKEENNNDALEVRNLAAESDAESAEEMIPEIEEKSRKRKSPFQSAERRERFSSLSSLCS